MNLLGKKFDYIIILILLSFCISIISFKHNLSNYDVIKKSINGSEYHVMIKADTYRYFSHGAEIKKDIQNGQNYFDSGRENFTKYLFPRIIAAYYYLFDYDLFNNWTEKKINLGIHSNYLLIQCIFYYFALFYFYLVIKKEIQKKVCFFIILFLGLEPTIFQYHGTFWSESIFFSLQLFLLALLIKNKNSLFSFLSIGILLGLFAIQRTPAIYYIVPVIVYFLWILKIEIYSKLLFTLIGYLAVLSFVGFHNYARSGLFYIIPNEVNSVLHSYVVPNIINKEELKKEKILTLDWMKKNNISANYEELSSKIDNIRVFTFCAEQKTSTTKINEKDGVKICNYINDRAIEIMINNPFSTFKYILKKSLHFTLLNPFHIYSDHHFSSGEEYYRSKTHQKLIPYRIAYSLLIYLISFIGFIKLLNDRNKKLLILSILSMIYFFIILSWHGNTRYFVPVLIYLSIFFGYGFFSIINLFNQKIKKIINE